MNTLQLQWFRWYGKDALGRKMHGEQQALHAHILHLDLQHQGITPIWVRKISKSRFNRAQTKIHSSDIAMFLRQFATLVNAGIPIVQALANLAQGQTKAPLRRMIAHMQLSVASGGSLASAFAAHPQVISPLVLSFIQAGEQAGALDMMLERVALYCEKSSQLRAQIKKALFYPMTVIILSLLITVGLLVFIVPQFTQIFMSFGANLPLATKIIIDLSRWMVQYAWLAAIGMVFILVGFRQGYRHFASFAYRIDTLVLKLYVIGPILQKATISRLCSTLAITFAAGMPLVNSLSIIAENTGNRVFAKAILAVRDGLLRGQPMHTAMQQQSLFPALMIQMVAVGEESGTLDAMLTKMATYYTIQVDMAVSHISTLIEPMIMLILGLLIGGLVIAMYLPIFRLGGVISGGGV